MRLQESDLIMIKGGFNLRYSVLAGLGGLILFLIGVVDGYMNPLRCNG